MRGENIRKYNILLLSLITLVMVLCYITSPVVATSQLWEQTSIHTPTYDNMTRWYVEDEHAYAWMYQTNKHVHSGDSFQIKLTNYFNMNDNINGEDFYINNLVRCIGKNVSKMGSTSIYTYDFRVNIQNKRLSEWEKTADLSFPIVNLDSGNVIKYLGYHIILDEN